MRTDSVLEKDIGCSPDARTMVFRPVVVTLFHAVVCNLLLYYYPSDTSTRFTHTRPDKLKVRSRMLTSFAVAHAQGRMYDGDRRIITAVHLNVNPRFGKSKNCCGNGGDRISNIQFSCPLEDISVIKMRLTVFFFFFVWIESLDK